MVAQDANTDTIIIPIIRRRKFFFIKFFCLGELIPVISKEGSVKLVHQRRNENMTDLLFYIVLRTFPIR